MSEPWEILPRREEVVATAKKVGEDWLPHSNEGKLAAYILATVLLPNEAGEAKAKAYREQANQTHFHGSPDELAQCAIMLDTYGPDCFPANERGQLHFARAMMESTADTIRAYFTAHHRVTAGLSKLMEACESWDKGFVDGEDFTPEQFRVWVNDRRRMAREALAFCKGGSNADKTVQA